MIASIIAPGFFTSLGEPLLWLISLGAIALLVLGADRVVSAAARLASAMGLSKVIIGATVVSLGTTSPEAAVSVTAAFQGQSGLALGNGVGSIICDTALIFGLCCCLTRLPKDRFVLNRHGWLKFASGSLLTGVTLLLWAFSGDIGDVWIPRWVGVGLLALLGGYLYLSVRWSRQHPEIIPDQAAVEMKRNHRTPRAVLTLLVLILGLAMVVGGSEFLIGSMKVICERRGVPDAVIAVTFVALGTSLPELATAITAIVRGHPALLVGNIIGADILNVLFVIGASATAMPLKVSPLFFYFLLPTMMLVLMLLQTYILMPGNRFRRWQGIPLLAVYAAFVALAAMLGLR